jgi:two-component system CheB/CheR fusion protein
MPYKNPDIPRELSDPSESFQKATESIGLHWWIWDHVERKLTLSPSLLGILGYRPEEFDPSVPEIYKNIHPEDAKENIPRISRLIYGKDPMYEIEFRVRDSSGEWQWYYNRGTVLQRDEKGKGMVIGGITMDISGQYRQLMAKIDERERLYQTLFEAAEDPIGLYGENMEMILVNSAMYKNFGYSREELTELSPLGLIHPDDRAILIGKLPTLLKEGNMSMDFRMVHKSGEIRHVSSESAVIPDESGKGKMILTIIRDTTNRIQAMEELEQAKVLAEESDRLKSAFLANMSHEIRTPMNSIVGFSNLLVNPALDEHARSLYVQRIVRNSELLLALISDIIDLAKIESGQLPIIYGRIRLSTLISDMRQYAMDELERMGKKGIEIITVEGGGDCEVETDVIRLAQIMKNLVNNAIKFTESGTITIGCRDEENEGWFRLYVKDTGIGIDPEHFELIFDQFRQIDGSNTRKFGGTGLGLAICKNLVRMMRGRIWVESAEGEGAHFQVELPKESTYHEEMEEGESRKAGDRAAKPAGLSILVVDDEMDTVELFRALLAGLGHRVVTASTGFEALELLDKQPGTDMVFMDVEMPVLSGTDTMRIMKERYEELFVVAQSAHALVGDRARFLKEGFDAYLPKPFTREQILEILAQK